MLYSKLIGTSGMIGDIVPLIVTFNPYAVVVAEHTALSVVLALIILSVAVVLTAPL